MYFVWMWIVDVFVCEFYISDFDLTFFFHFYFYQYVVVVLISFTKGLLSLWKSNWYECDIKMCQHNHHTYKNDIFGSSLFTQKRSIHNQHKNKHSTNIASIGMCVFSFIFYFFSFFFCCFC